MESTLERTKRHLKYFRQSFFKDKVAMTLCCLILVTLVAILWVWLGVPNKESAEGAVIGSYNVG